MSIRRAAARLPRRIVLVAVLCAALGAGGARAQDSTETAIPEPVGFVNDQAGVIDEPARAKLEGFLDQVKRKTGAEFAVLTMRTTAPLDPDEYKVKVFERWGLGRQGEDDGLLMLVAIEERVVRFETGYGLEGALPDGLQSRIFRTEMRDHFRTGDFSGGITAGVLASAAYIAREKGVTLEWDGRELRYRPERRDRLPGWVVPLALAFFIFVVMPAMAGDGRRRRRRRGGWFWGGPGTFGGGWGGGFGGGLGGGGWSSGGGGGGSFGGFGGGASGGGGGGGSW
jgi:uncharacterized protein